MKKIFLFLAVVSLLFCGCSKGKAIPEKDMVAIFYDMYLAEGMFESIPEFTKGTDSLNVYAPLLRQHGYDEDQFREALRDYLEDPEAFHEVMNTVRARLEQTLRKTEEAEEAESAVINEGENRKHAMHAEGVEAAQEEVATDSEEAVSEPGEVKEVKQLERPERLEKVDEVEKQVQKARNQKVRKNKKVSKKDLKALEESLNN